MKLNVKTIEMPEKLREWAEKQDEHQARHIGTHIDVYNYSDLDLSLKLCRGVVVDVRGIDIIDCERVEKIEVRKGDFIIFRTGFMEKFGYGTKEYLNLEGAPFLTDEAVNSLIDRGVKFIGIDLHGIQHGRDHRKIDEYTESKGTYVIENMTNLDKISEIIQLKLEWDQKEGATAIPVEIEVLG
ncbi:cyclase family protein [Psychrilyobacter atlanticus]|uniref:cyclase family protein n=1 Tax=Psychrilyobacter atlanticus TaxID=271091 RepID=UPI00040E1A6C|nr:cyclase family protein [Psychrilyobacter atlanticus]